MMHGSGWHRYIRSGDEKPSLTWNLLKRVLGYSSTYRWHLVGMLILILANSGLSLLSPLILRDLIDVTIPSKDIHRLVMLSLGLLALPALKGVISVMQRRLNTEVGEGVIFDLRSALLVLHQIYSVDNQQYFHQIILEFLLSFYLIRSILLVFEKLPKLTV